MNVYVTVAECHCCHQITEIGYMETPKLLICQCSLCQKVWKVFEDLSERMIRYKEKGPDTFDEVLLCPVCWRILQPDYTLWSIVCIDPTCGYSRRIPGLSREQEKVKTEYLDLKHQVFSLASKGEVPEDIKAEYERQKLAYNRIKRYDSGTRKPGEPIIPLPTG